MIDISWTWEMCSTRVGYVVFEVWMIAPRGQELEMIPFFYANTHLDLIPPRSHGDMKLELVNESKAYDKYLNIRAV
jgi:hypothetical protein